MCASCHQRACVPKCTRALIAKVVPKWHILKSYNMRHNVESTDCRQYAISRRGIVGLSSLTFCGIYQPFSLSYKTSLSPLHCSLILPFYAFNIPGALVCSSTLYTDGRWIPALKRGKVYAYRCIGCNKIESIDRINPEK